MAIQSLPNDPMMLLSFVNTRLRDDGISLADFCAQFDVIPEYVQDKLKAIDYTYNEELNKFV